MGTAAGLDQRYIEFRDRTAPVFARFPQMEPLRYTIFRDLVIQPRATGLRDTVKHWLRPLVRPGRTTQALEHTDILMWVEGGRSILGDTLLPVFREVVRRGARARLVSYGGPATLPDQTACFQHLHCARAPVWAEAAWEALGAVEPHIHRASLRRSFYHACANLSGLLSEMNRVLEVMRPTVVVAASSQMIGGHGLFVAARQRGLPTVLLQHGVVQPFYTPLSADVMLTWGRASCDTLERFGMESNRLVPLGSPRHDSMGHSHSGTARQTMLQKLALSDRCILVFFSNGNDLLRNGTAPMECARWLNAIAERFKDRLHVVVRLHPNEDGSLYRPYPRLVLTDTTLPFDQLMDACDCVSSLCSTAMYEALLYGKPVWQFHADGWPELADNCSGGYARRISSETDLSAQVTQMLHAGRRAAETNGLIHEVFANHGRAAEVVADYLLSEAWSNDRRPPMTAPATTSGRS
jgi:hypothetical protein